MFPVQLNSISIPALFASSTFILNKLYLLDYSQILSLNFIHHLVIDNITLNYFFDFLLLD